MALDRTLSLTPRCSFVAAVAAATALVVTLAFVHPVRAQWTPDTRVTIDPAISRTEIDGGRNVVVADQILMMVWTDTRDGNPEIYFRERVAGIWGSDERLTNDGAFSLHPAIGRQAGDVRVAWEDQRSGRPEIWTKRKVLGAWTPDSCVTCDDFDSARPSLDHTGEHLVWEETKDGNREIYYRRRLESGVWEPEFRVSNDAAESSHPTVASPHWASEPWDPDLRIVAWQDARHGAWEIYARYNRGVWGVEKRVSSDPDSSRHPSVAVEADATCGSDIGFIAHWVAWQDDRHGNEEIYFAGGEEGFWHAPFRLTDNVSESQHPSVGKAYRIAHGPFGGIGLCSGPALLWEERTSTTAGSIQYQDLTTSDPAAPISAAGADPDHVSFGLVHEWPTPGAVAGELAAVWTDARDGNEEIYLAEGATFIDATPAPEAGPELGGLVIGPARPNPFRGETRFSVLVADGSELSVRVVDVGGRAVRELFAGDGAAESRELTWDGRDHRGERVAAGTYFLTAEAAGRRVVQRVSLMR